jgi:SAM-dependent methyltransferase
MSINETELRRYLNVMKRAIALIEGMLEHDDGGTMEQLMAEQPPFPPIKIVQPDPPPTIQLVDDKLPVQPEPEINMNDPEHKAARQKHIQDLMGIDEWIPAVPPFLVSAEVSREDQINRANNVLDMMIDRNMEGKSFLDFGCGEGWITQEAAKRGVSEVLGYDIKIDPNWAHREGVQFTSDFGLVPTQHFDFVMLYDVLDHCEDPVDVMAKVRSVLKPEGVVFVRCHPWTARHATHLYKQGVNKAYWHMFLSWDEIKEQIKDEPMFTRPEKNPVVAYHWWFKDFKIEKERLIEEDVSEFFFVPSFKELLANEQQIPLEEIDEYLARMRIQFADYVLGPQQ